MTPNQLSDDLLPCPFCGESELSFVQMTSFHPDETTKWRRVKCGTCGTQAPETVWNKRSHTHIERGVGEGWLVWSNEHEAWWGPKQSGYYTNINSAGRYSLAEAESCARVRSRNERDTPPEVVVPSPELIERLLSVTTSPSPTRREGDVQSIIDQLTAIADNTPEEWRKDRIASAIGWLTAASLNQRTAPPTDSREVDAQKLDAVRKFVKNDTIAITYQTLGQYRSAILAALAAPPLPQPAHESRPVVLDEISRDAVSEMSPEKIRQKVAADLDVLQKHTGAQESRGEDDDRTPPGQSEGGD